MIWTWALLARTWASTVFVRRHQLSGSRSELPRQIHKRAFRYARRRDPEGPLLSSFVNTYNQGRRVPWKIVGTHFEACSAAIGKHQLAEVIRRETRFADAVPSGRSRTTALAVQLLA